MKFGTSGLRGLVTDMTDAVVEAHVAAFLAHLGRDGRPAPALLIGRDLRPSSPRIAEACARAAVRQGADAVDCGALPTPALALETLARGLPSVMVTGSHIPFDRNGLKFYRPDGEITKDDEAGVLAALDAPRPPAAAPGRRLEEAGAARRYLDRARAFFPAGFLTGRRIGVYQHSAVGRDLLVALFEGFGATVVPLGRAEGFVPIDTEAVRPEDAEQAAAWAAEHGLDALVSTDGDGDRPLMADETGRFLRGDMLGVLTARFLGADAVATPVSSNTALERTGWFPRVLRTRIGSPFVIAAMAELTADGARLPVSYEANGGFLLGAEAQAGEARLAPLPTRDAVLPMLAALALAAEAGGPLSALAASLPARFTASDRLQEVAPEKSAALATALAEDAAARADFLAAAGLPQAEAVDALDGVRMTAGAAILHLRPSGNAPELRVYAEAESEARAAALVAAGLAAAAARLPQA